MGRAFKVEELSCSHMLGSGISGCVMSKRLGIVAALVLNKGAVRKVA